MAKRMVRGDSAHQGGPVRYPQCLLDSSVTISKVGITPAVGFTNTKIGDISPCGAPTRSRMAKWMAQGDLAH